MTNPHHLVPTDDELALDVTPESAGWDHLAFRIVRLAAGASHQWESPDREAAIVPLSGTATVTIGDREISLARDSVFTELGRVVYVPPRTPVVITAVEPFELTLGSAPAEGLLPPRVVETSEMRSEIRGGGTALRQVIHTLAPPLEAERLILYEVYVPRGTWSGWPPHAHDGREGSPYLEEVYYFRTQPTEGFAFHRNWRDEEDFDESFAASDGDVVLVTRGYHSSAAAPGSNVYFLNYLAGELVMDQRVTPPCFHADHTWIEADWDAGAWNLPVITTTGR
ncbi:MAG: 5-deoxy-glucuronate isomerase [Acidimicrobiales bacterium]